MPWRRREVPKTPSPRTSERTCPSGVEPKHINVACLQRVLRPEAPQADPAPHAPAPTQVIPPARVWNWHYRRLPALMLQICPRAKRTEKHPVSFSILWESTDIDFLPESETCAQQPMGLQIWHCSIKVQRVPAFCQSVHL